jgi:hypothetical protein
MPTNMFGQAVLLSENISPLSHVLRGVNNDFLYMALIGYSIEAIATFLTYKAADFWPVLIQRQEFVCKPREFQFVISDIENIRIDVDVINPVWILG